MMYYTHMAFAFLMALFAYPFSPKIPLLWYLGLALFGALLPDIDHKKSMISKWFYPLAVIITFLFRHRGMVHSLLFMTGFSLLVYYYVGLPFAVPLALGFLSHIIIDSFTVHGINYLYPLTTFKVSGFIETGKAGEFVLFLVLLVLIVMKMFFW